MAGRPPKPTSLKLLSGNPGRRPLPVGEPKPPKITRSRPPAWLNRIAKAEWRRIAPTLTDLELLTESDIALLSSYCLAWSRLVEAQKIIDKEGITTVDPSTLKVYRHPACAIASEASSELRQLCTQFGLSPSSRGRLGVVPPKKPEADPGNELFA